MKRILITGSNGLLGQRLAEMMIHSSGYRLLLTSKHEHSVFAENAVEYRTMDVTDRNAVRTVIEEFEPETIINTAAITNVDQCEKERELAWRVNVRSVEHLTYAAKLSGAKIIHLSTDYVFDGKSGPYSELDRPNPLSYYGKTKLASENVLRTSGVPHTIVRTMVLYGIGFGVKLNFALWVLKSLGEGNAIHVVNDQIGNPTFADDLAYALLKIVDLGGSELYHVAGEELVSRFDFAVALARVFNLNRKLIEPVKTSAFKQPAARPLKSGFIILKAETELGIKMSGVERGLMAFKNQVTHQLGEVTFANTKP